jgi:hypothetical protein
LGIHSTLADKTHVPFNPCRQTVKEENAVPINFGDIALHHKRIASRYYLLAQIERNCGKHSEADYHAQLAVRYIQAAREQKIVMSRTPGRFIEVKKTRPWTIAFRPRPLPTACWNAVQRLSGKLAAAIRHSIPKRELPFQGLSLN